MGREGAAGLSGTAAGPGPRASARGSLDARLPPPHPPGGDGATAGARGGARAGGLLDVSVRRIYFTLPKERGVLRPPLPREKTRM